MLAKSPELFGVFREGFSRSERFKAAERYLPESRTIKIAEREARACDFLGSFRGLRLRPEIPQKSGVTA